jgi:predicted ATPase
LNSEPVIRQAKKRKYQGIFFLDRLPYKKDYARIENIKTADKLEKLLRKTYKNLGYNVIRVPVKPIDERIRFILSKLDPPR